MQRTSMVLSFCLLILFVSSIPAPGQNQNATLSGIEDWIKGAENGNDILHYGLAQGYQEGRWICENKEEALKWYRRAAEQGNLEAQFALGSRHALDGTGDNAGFYPGYLWLDLRRAGSVDERIGEIRDSAAEKLTSEQIAEARRPASAWVTGCLQSMGNGSCAFQSASAHFYGCGSTSQSRRQDFHRIDDWKRWK